MDSKNKSVQKKKLRRFGFGQKTYVFFICLVLSSMIWALIKLSKDFDEVIYCRVNFTNIPEGKIIVNDPDTLLTLHLKLKGFKLMSNWLFKKQNVLKLNIGSLLQKKNNTKDEYYIVSSDINPIIGKQIALANSITAISPDTLFFRLENIFSKKVPVKVNLKYFFARQYDTPDSVKYTPDSVTVSGPKAAVDSVKFIETVRKTLTGLKSSQTLSLDFNKKYGSLKLKIIPESEKVYIPVEKFTESSVEVTVNIINNTSNYIVRTFPEKVKVTFMVSLSDYKNALPSEFTAVADISKALASKSKKLNVELSAFPGFVKINKIEPEKIEFIILK